MLDKIKKAISMYGMVSNGDSIYIGLSGGADSVSLLVALNELRDEYGIELNAIHINHMLRGDESMRDEAFCVDVCSRYGVPLTVERIDVNAYCREHKVSTEDGARTLRYGVFDRLANGAKVATAHTLSDNCETMLYNLTRGAGTKGLMGIPPVRDNVIRPLILCTRQEVESFLSVRGVGFVVDSTNLSDDYTRNKIRHNVVPVLKSINPQFETRVSDTIAILSDDNLYIDSIANRLYDAHISTDAKTLNVDLRDYHNAIKYRCIVRLFKQNALTYSRDRVLAIENAIANDGKVNVTKDTYCIANGGILSIVNIPAKEATDTGTPIRLKINGKTRFHNKVVETRLLEKVGFIHKKLTYYILDYDKIQGETLLRGRVFGDRIQLKGRGFTSSVKKLINENIPEPSRQSLCFIQDDVGLIFMERLGIAQRVACDKSTKRYLTIKIVEDYQN